MESDATDSPHGTDSATENSPTWSTEEEAELTARQIASGPVETVTENITPVPSSLLSDDEQKRLARIRSDRRSGWMQSAGDVEFLLEIVKRCGL